MDGSEPAAIDRGVRHYTSSDIHRLVSWDDAVASQVQAFVNLVTGEGALAPRGLVNYDGGTAFGYLARCSRHGWPVVKIGSVSEGNAELGLPSVHAYVFVLDRRTGALCATFDGEAITLLRTPAGSIAALECLGDGPGRDGAVAIVGSGRQAVAHREAIASRYPARDVRVLASRSASDVEAGLRGSSTVILSTSSRTPVVDADWLEPGSLVVSIGAFAPDRMEFGRDLISRAKVVFVDDANTAQRQCGPVADALASGALQRGHVVSIGSLLATPLRPSDLPIGDIYLYASVGLGIQDAAVVDLVMGRQHDRP